MARSQTREREPTELEGAILSAVRRAGAVTAYRIRQAFLASPSVEWSGSAGAVYPAMRRLEAAGLLSATSSDDRRGTAHYRVTKAGEAALLVWAGDVTRSVSAGIDPFRGRVPEWMLLAPGQRAPILRAVERALNARCDALKSKVAASDRIERVQAMLELELHRARLRWIAANR